jgi:hypothetical protein
MIMRSKVNVEDPISENTIFEGARKDDYPYSSRVQIRKNLLVTNKYEKATLTVSIGKGTPTPSIPDLVLCALAAILQAYVKGHLEKDLLRSLFTATLNDTKKFVGANLDGTYIPIAKTSAHYDEIMCQGTNVEDFPMKWDDDDLTLANFLADRLDLLIQARAILSDDPAYMASGDQEVVGEASSGRIASAENKEIIFYVLKSRNIGCRQNKDENSYARMMSKMKTSVRKTRFFDPEGLDRNGRGKNCFVECYLDYTSQHGKQPKPITSAQEKSLWSMEEIVTFLTGHVNFKIISTKSAEEDDETELYNTGIAKGLVRQYTYVAHETKDQTDSLILMCYRTSYGSLHCIRWKAEHAVVSSAQCRKCSGWIDYSKVLTFSGHILNCIKCICGSAIRKDGVHYIKCPNRPTVFSTTTGKHKLHPMPVKNDESNGLKNQYFCDFETAAVQGTRHEVYAWACRDIEQEDGEVRVEIGKNVIRSFIEWIFSGVSGYVWFHNGSGFDFNFILEAIVKYKKIKPLEIIMKGNKVLSFKIEENGGCLYFRDTYLFLPCSLAKLCKDFKVPADITKSSIEHNIKTFEEIEGRRTEIDGYIRRDVLCLEYIYKSFSKAFWTICPQALCQSISLASHAYSMWRTMEDPKIISSIYKPTSTEMYTILRSMYYGGRVMATRKEFKTVIAGVDLLNKRNYDENGKYIGDAYDLGDDYLKDVDVVSLYPSVMMRYRFPVGKPETLVFNEADSTNYISRLSNELTKKFPDDKSFKDEIFRTAMLVDITPNTKLHLSFLMRRDDKGSMMQDLLPIKNAWYTGVELWEACRLGYKIERIHSAIRWPELKHVFRAYIGKLFETKEKHKHDKSNAEYIAAKWAMNSLSGKFGQKKVDLKTLLISELDDIDNLASLQELRPIGIDGDKEDGYLYSRKEEVEPSHAIQLSVWILSYARRHMSRIVRGMGGYYNPERTYLYTDTDSLIVSKQTFDCIPKKFVGEALGQLCDELANSPIIEAVFLAPKTYGFAYLKDGTHLTFKTRCKGIPHRGDPIPLKDTLAEYSHEDVLSKLDGGVDLGYKKYVITVDGDDATATVVACITTSTMRRVLLGNARCDVVYGSIQKNAGGSTFGIKPEWRMRGLSVNNWWTKDNCPRIVKGFAYDATLARGQTDPDAEFNLFLNSDYQEITQNQEEFFNDVWML